MERVSVMYSKVTLNILTPYSFEHEEEGKAFLHFLVKSYPEMVPQKYNYVDPVKFNFDVNDIDTALAGWKNGFLWKRKMPDLDGSLWKPSRPDLHGWLTMDLVSGDPEQARMDRFLKDASSFLNADFGFLHVLNPIEIAKTRKNGTIGCISPKRQEYQIDVTSHDLHKFVPNLFWATVFGEPYVNMVGRERMLSSPAPVVEELPYGGIYIQLSESISDMLTDYERVDKVRQRVKDHLNNNIFFEPDAFEDQSYSVPNFHLGEN